MVDRSGGEMHRWHSSYEQAYKEAPWFDQPDALDVLAQRHRDGVYDDEQRTLFQKWIEDGYFVLDGLFDVALIDEMLADLDAIWTADTPIEGLSISGIGLDPDHPSESPHHLLLELPLAERARLRETHRWRVHGFYEYSRAAAAIYHMDDVRNLMSLLFDHPAQEHYTINFEYGSEQVAHQDMAVFAIDPPNYLMGLWLACEDIGAGSGPLVFYPGSHRERMWGPLAENYPQTSLRTCSSDVTRAYYDHLAELAKRYERREFLASKGQALVWHGMILHGGDIASDRRATRKSYVCHYIGDGTDKLSEIVGPFNW